MVGRRMVARAGCLLAIVVAGFSGAAAWAQGNQIPPGGVYIDADGVLRARDTVRGSAASKLQKLRRDKGARAKAPAGDLAYISLPTLFAEARRLVEAGKPLSLDMRTLGGMVKLQYVFVYPEEKDLVIAGSAEPVELSDPARLSGKLTGRATLRLEDLVTAMRTVGTGPRLRPFGCSLDLPPNAMADLQAVATRIGAIDPGNDRAAAQVLRNAIGPQQVRLIGVEPNNMLAFVCVEADYMLKRLALGLDKSPVAAVKSHMALMRQGDGPFQRWWFVPSYEPIRMSPDGNAYELRGPSLKVKSADKPEGDEVSKTASARKFAELVSQNFPALAAAIPSFGDLANVADLGVLAGLIARDELAAKVGWDTTWLLDPNGFPAPKVATPKEVETLVNHKNFGSTISVAVGGVVLSVEPSIGSENRTKDAVVAQQAKRPKTGQWLMKPDAR